MRHLLLTTLLFSSTALAQPAVTGADEITSDIDKSGNPTILKSIKLAEPSTNVAQHNQTDLNFLRERAEVSVGKSVGNAKQGNFSCPDGTEPSCLNPGDKVCPGSARCVDDRATCFDEYPCDTSGGFVCASQYDNALNQNKEVVRQYDELVAENVGLREKRLEQKNCVLNASVLEEARKCVR